MFTMDSFGSDLPSNWEALCEFLNSKADLLSNDLTDDERNDILNDIWEEFCMGGYDDYPDFPGYGQPVTRSWKVYGRDGHRQRESFNRSAVYDFSSAGDTRIIELVNSDKTGTNDYTIIRITRNTPAECLNELEVQFSDGAFENSSHGKVEEI